MKIVLASASPRRRELLEALGLSFEILSPAINEVGTGDPAEAVIANARTKARAVADQLTDPALVIGADTEVVLDGILLGKAATEAEARERLEALSGRTHEVLTGLAVILPSPPVDHPEERTAVETSRVTFAPLPEPLIHRYLAAGEWRDRAGAYAVQGLGSMLVERVDGDLANVIGLPLRRLLDLVPEIAGNS
jgi:septum formation protein